MVALLQSGRAACVAAQVPERLIGYIVRNSAEVSPSTGCMEFDRLGLLVPSLEGATQLVEAYMDTECADDTHELPYDIRVVDMRETELILRLLADVNERGLAYIRTLPRRSKRIAVAQAHGATTTWTHLC